MSETFGEFVSYSELSEVEKRLVDSACEASAFSYSPHSNFAVGSAILAFNSAGESKVFRGCNVENELIKVGVCAERNVASTAISEGFTEFKLISVVAYDKNPGGSFSGASPCGICRQFIAQWSLDADILIVVDSENNVRRARVADLLPAPRGERHNFDSLSSDEKRLIAAVLSHEHAPHAPYSGKPRKAMLLASGPDNVAEIFAGVETELATYSGSITAVGAACGAAVTAGCPKVSAVAVLGSANLDGFSLQLLREFGPGVNILFVSDDKSVVRSSLSELLPNSFGPL